MKWRNQAVLFFALAISCSVAGLAFADPCGMVPPIYPGQQVPLARIGEQKTYVFYKDGVEAFVIRPGFTGKVEEFGMLIPFPSPPALRKVPDHVFEHISAAIDPPEVVVDLTPRPVLALGGIVSQTQQAQSSSQGLDVLRRNEVRVLREEAVGMYEVAVLEAGSAAALNRWMDEHGYKYPQGMDKPCNEYVADGWCFVAVKAKVGQKSGVDPKPGQRAVDAKLPAGSSFDGYVQGMGFRFRTDELVVPMRLSAFNEGELHNVVYLLTDRPQKIRSIPEEYVVRQVSGPQLHHNVTDPLPLRIIGGTVGDIPDNRKRTLVQQRNPAPHNGAAKELFAADLLAVRGDRLALPHEEKEKELLRIGERFGLRGPQIDKLNEQGLAELRSKSTDGAAEDLKDMTLTVVDGDFPREVLAKQNLQFDEYHMSARRNRPDVYDAKLLGPAPKRAGVRHLGHVSPAVNDRPSAESKIENAVAARASAGGFHFAFILVAFSIVTTGVVLVLRRRNKTRPGKLGAA